MSLLHSLITYTMEYIMLLLFIMKLHTSYKAPRILDIILPTTICITLAVSIDTFVSQEWISSLTIILLYYFCFRHILKKILKSTEDQTLLFSFFLSYLGVCLVEVLVTLIFFFIPMPSSSYELEIYSIVSLIIVLCIYFLLPNRWFCSLSDSMPLWLKVSIINGSAILFMLSLYFKISKNQYYQSLAFVLTCTLLILAINTYFFVINRRIYQLEVTVKSYNDHIPVIHTLINDIRERQHDYNNLIQSVQMLPITHTDYESLSNALMDKNITLKFADTPINLLNLNYKLLAGFIYSKCVQADAMSHRVIVTIHNCTLNSSAPEYDLIELLGILLDNAIEASPPNEDILLELDSSDSTTSIKTKNVSPALSDSLIVQLFQPGYSTKEKDSSLPRGYGLSRLKKIVHKHNGHVFVTNEPLESKNYVVFEVLI